MSEANEVERDVMFEVERLFLNYCEQHSIDDTTENYKAILAAFCCGANIFRKKEQAAQAKIDSLMLEHCPEEMSIEQVAEFAAHQVSS